MKTKTSNNSPIKKMKVDKELPTKKKADTTTATKKKVRKVKKEKASVSVKEGQTIDGKAIGGKTTPKTKGVKKATKQPVLKKTKAERKKALKRRKIRERSQKRLNPKIEKVTKLKRWMKERGIIQKDLATQTRCSTNTINYLIKDGKASDSIKEIVSLKLGISFEQLQELLKFEEPISI